MKNAIKKIILFLVLVLTFFFSGCEKDFDESVKTNQENILPEGFFVKKYTEQELTGIPNLKPLLIAAKKFLIIPIPQAIHLKIHQTKQFHI